MIKRMVIAVVLIVLVCGGLVGFNLFKARAIDQFFANRKLPPVTVSDTEVEAITWTPGIEAVGTAWATSGVTVPAEVAGVIRQIKFNANDHVREGEVLVIQDDTIEQADLVSAQAALKRDQLTLDRARKLAERGVSSQEVLDNAQAALEVSAAQVEKVKATIGKKWIKAPFGGVIGIPQVDIGQYLTAGTAIATLQNLDEIKVDFTVTEQDFPDLKIGQTVRVGTGDSKLDHEGKITGIDPKIDPQSRLASVQAHVTNKDGGLQPGQFLRIRVELPTEDNVVAVPQTAIVTSLYGDFVYRVDEQKPKDAGASGEPSGEDTKPTLVARQVFVTLGRRNGTLVEIKQGLKPGDRIVTAGQNKVSNGSELVINNSIDPAKIGRQFQALEDGS